LSTICRSGAASYSTVPAWTRARVSALMPFSAISRGPGKVTAAYGSAVTMRPKVDSEVVASTSNSFSGGSSARFSARPSGATAHST
jgi:hypothetical protein